MEYILNKQIINASIIILIAIFFLYLSYKKKVWTLFVLCLFAILMYSIKIITNYLLIKSHVVITGYITGSSSSIKQTRTWGYHFNFKEEEYNSSGVPYDFINVNIDSIKYGQKYEVWVHPIFPNINEIDFSNRVK